MNLRFYSIAAGLNGILAASIFSAVVEMPTLNTPVLSISSSGRLTASKLEPGKQTVVQWSSNLVNWLEIRSFKPINSEFSWSELRPASLGFYRVIQNPGPQKLVSATIYQTMRNKGVPGFSVAVITNGTIAWAQGYGELAKRTSRWVDTNTLFQAASISKPTTALAALKMVDQGVLSLDEPVNNRLKTVQIPGENGMKVTLRHILSHTGGLSVHGFPGYEVGSEIPSLVQILKGETPANTAPIVANGPIGTFLYSGGGYTFLQALLIDVSGEAFPDLLRRSVLEPLGMSRSTFCQPLSTDLECNAACAHVNGTAIDGNCHIYPELAAAGLWTTPTDLARMWIAIRSAYLGNPSSILTQQTAKEMLTNQVNAGPERWGLGPQLQELNGALFDFLHTGGNHGFLSGIIVLMETGNGVASMWNSDVSMDLEVYLACVDAYGW